MKEGVSMQVGESVCIKIRITDIEIRLYSSQLWKESKYLKKTQRKSRIC